MMDEQYISILTLHMRKLRPGGGVRQPTQSQPTTEDQSQVGSPPMTSKPKPNPQPPDPG